MKSGLSFNFIWDQIEILFEIVESAKKTTWSSAQVLQKIRDKSYEIFKFNFNVGKDVLKQICFIKMVRFIRANISV